MATGFRKTLFILLTCHLLLLLPRGDSKCPRSYPCRNFTLEFPFTDANHPGCGLIQVQDCSNSSSQHQHPTVEVGGSTGYLHLISILGKMSENSFLVEDLSFQNVLYTRKCIALQNMDDYLPNTPSVSFTFSPNITCYSCYRGPHIADHFKYFDKQECEYTDLYYQRNSSSHHLPTGEIPPGCRKIQLPSKPDPRPDDHTLFNLTTATFSVEWHVSKACLKCYNGGGQCLTDTQNNTFHCRKDKSRLKVILALSLSGAGLLLLLSITFLIWLRKKNSSKKNLISRNISSHTSSKSDIEGGIFYFGIPVFSRTELEKATNNFDASKQLGDGGFGTVYHGTLLDGREVAVKRLYEHNFRREEQFLNEIKILTSLRHPNLVSLYGCTSRRSQELLLVYEYISNGTVADHLHGERAAESPLSWPVRMSIAIETATALAYLHKSDIIHRDVKTTNILLDKKFSVKVTDFGLSRLFPDNVTHVSTCPQGTPGYVDPEYYQCYQLTDKSDVYSFGVVLIELISSMPAVDVSRHRHEINLANLAMNRIQRGAFDELIDPSLGYDSDLEVTRMTTAVAGLAFGCLQHDKDLRPSMDEVLSFLKDIEGGEDCNTDQMTSIGASPEREDDVLLRNNKLLESSPNAVTDAWVSSASSTRSFT